MFRGVYPTNVFALYGMLGNITRGVVGLVGFDLTLLLELQFLFRKILP